MKIIYLTYLETDDLLFLVRIISRACVLVRKSSMVYKTPFIERLYSISKYFDECLNQLDNSDDEALECSISISNSQDLQKVADNFIDNDSDALRFSRLLLSFVIPYESQILE